MQNSFTWMYKLAARLLRDQEQSSTGNGYLNHALPEVLDRKSSQKSIRSHPILPQNQPSIPHPSSQPSSSVDPPTNTPLSPTLLQPRSRPVTRARSMSDLLSQEARDRVAEPSAAIIRKASATMIAHLSRSTEEARNNQPEEELETKAGAGAGTRPSEHNISVLVLPPKFRQDKYAFMTVDNMIVRLSGGMVPGWDIQFNQNFMMTFRRFATPREILVGMVLRLRTTTDEEEKRRAVLILFDYLLEWIFKYPRDFATPGAIAPFISLIGLFKNKFSHEGAPRLEERLEYLATCTDDAADWAKVDAEFTEGDDSDTEGARSRTQSAEVDRSSPMASIKVSVSTSIAITPTLEPSSSKVAESSGGLSASGGLLPRLFLRPSGKLVFRTPPLSLTSI
ncbi:hypothetical protein FRC12_013005 [Ceratobasidium sp. 428]|nr:hypothetical protein FRC12_013005 [Ceratobasidium sp. 428]